MIFWGAVCLSYPLNYPHVISKDLIKQSREWFKLPGRKMVSVTYLLILL